MEIDFQALKRAGEALENKRRDYAGNSTLLPEEPTPLGGGSGAG